MVFCGCLELKRRSATDVHVPATRFAKNFQPPDKIFHVRLHPTIPRTYVQEVCVDAIRSMYSDCCYRIKVWNCERRTTMVLEEKAIIAFNLKTPWPFPVGCSLRIAQANRRIDRAGRGCRKDRAGAQQSSLGTMTVASPARKGRLYQQPHNLEGLYQVTREGHHTW